MLLQISGAPLVVQVALIALSLAAAVYYKKRRKSAYVLPLPPSPPAHWLFGNEFPKAYPHRTFLEWSRLYGPVFSLQKGSNLTIVICGHQAALDIMEKENAHLVDRPRSISAGEIMSGGMRTVLIGQGERFRKFRKALQLQLNIKIAEVYEPVQARAAKAVILDILDNPNNHIAHVRRYAASVIMSLAYGKTTPTSYSDPEVLMVNKCLARMGRVLLPGRQLVDSYPVLQYVPGLHRELYRAHEEELNLFRSQLQIVREKMLKNEAKPSFAKFILEKQREYGVTDDELAYLAGSMFGAGSDTSAAAISIVVMAAACFPEAQRKVQEQLDAVIGRSRMPAFGDMSDLTEVTAFQLESYRWRPVSLGFPHRATKDIIWGQYCIPKGATVLGSQWAIAHDPDAFHDPEDFVPSRWFTESGEINDKMRSLSFGFGRRVCPGQHVANRSVFINTAMLLWSFEISEDPEAPIDTMAFTDTINNHPLPFRVKFRPRIDNLKEFVGSSMYP